MTYASNHPVRLVGGRLALDLVNTADWSATDQVVHEKIASSDDLKVWLNALVLHGRVHDRAKADSAIVNGFLTLLIALYDQRRPHDILGFEPSFAVRLGLGAQMAPSRANGLAKVVERIHALAAA